MGTPTNTVAYTYKSSTIWGDMIDSYGTSDYHPHDGAGNLRYDGTWIYNWENGRELTSMTQGETAWTFSYDANGMRTKRTDGTAQSTYTYVYDGSQLVQMTVEGYTLDFLYDASGTPLAFSMGSMSFYYDTNLQGDVVAIRDTSGNVLVRYAYDAWGNFEIIQNHQIAEYNPLLYRGYVYDHEIGLYYLQSRYYDPEWGRFISADGYYSTGQGFLGNNMFAYCNNNPILLSDTTGTRAVINTRGFDYTSYVYVRDVTEEIMTALHETASFLHNHNQYLVFQHARNADPLEMITGLYKKLNNFKDLVNHNAPWDIKMPQSWFNTIGTPFPGHGVEVLFHGKRMTPEMLGNFTYGYLGYYAGIPLDTLYIGSYVAAKFPALLTNGFGAELWDWQYITMGYLFAEDEDQQ